MTLTRLGGMQPVMVLPPAVQPSVLAGSQPRAVVLSVPPTTEPRWATVRRVRESFFTAVFFMPAGKASADPTRTALQVIEVYMLNTR